QGKQLLKQFGVDVQEGIVVENENKMDEAYQQLRDETGTDFVVVKAQIHAGGRGKGGGVKLAKNQEEYKEVANNILGMMLKTPQTPGGMDGEGKLVQKILVAEDVYAPDFDANEEMYISILTDRERNCNVIVYSTEGGMDIEAVAEESPEKVYKEFIAAEGGLLPYQQGKIAFNLGLSGQAFKGMTKFIGNLYKAFTSSDASLFEIKP